MHQEPELDQLSDLQVHDLHLEADQALVQADHHLAVVDFHLHQDLIAQHLDQHLEAQVHDLLLEADHHLVVHDQALVEDHDSQDVEVDEEMKDQIFIIQNL
jgi:hypothetical protein